MDVRLVTSDGKEVDCVPPTDGISVVEAKEIMKTFSENISPQQLANRMFLHDVMLTEGFVPFYGEWWHFMYGDREWAAFTGENSALYAPVVITVHPSFS